LARIGYRAWQFWRTIWGRPKAADLSLARRQLSAQLYALFEQMPPAEQAHALRVFTAVKAAGFEDQALLEAALLHDVGKSRCRLFPWERAWVVLGNVFFPQKMAEWGQGEPLGWRKAFVVAVQHAEWGAQMLEDAGAGELTVRLVREHQTASPAGFSVEEAALLAALKQADNEN
jgi:putative nucleotidyltransferase with HDIG domain